MDLDLRHKVAIVTGGSRGIGRAVARQLAREGADVVIAARDSVRVAGSAGEISRETGARLLGIPCDVASSDSVQAMVARAVADLGGVDILVNCAGRPGFEVPRLPLEEITAEQLWSELNVKVMGYLRVMQAVAPFMIQRGSGRIVNISGLAARTTGSTIGSIRNVAVAAMSKNIADELGRHGVSVIVVHPDLSRTEKTPDVIRAQAARLGVTDAVAEKALGTRNVLGRLIDAEEIAYVIAFLVSPKAIAMNGDVVVVGGGIPGPIYY